MNKRHVCTQYSKDKAVDYLLVSVQVMHNGTSNIIFIRHVMVSFRRP